jgi:N-acyl-L-homoserine lactone synthetase
MQLTRRVDQPSACDCKKERAMLKLIEESYASFFPKEMDAMFRNRAETFSERLGWEVMVKDGYERDRFDANALYLVSVDPHTEEYWGSLRLLPTTGPNMLRDVFPQLLDGDYIESATIWECSRICAVAARPAGKKRRRRQLRPERAHPGHRRSCGHSRVDPNRGRL